MKKLLMTMLITGITLLALSGCKGSVEDPTDADDTNLDNNGAIYVTIDAYGLLGGTLSVTQAGEEGVESVAWGFEASQGDKVSDMLAKEEITAIDAVLEGDTFEGWMIFEEIITSDEDGFDTITYELRSGDTIYTTEELMELAIPEYNAAFVAKWASLPIEDYFVEDDYMFDADETTASITLIANGGNMLFIRSDGSDEIDSPVYSYWLEAGQTINDVMTEEAWHSLVSVEKEGASFTGWSVYEGDFVSWSSEAINDETTTSFEYDNRYEGFEYITVDNCVLYNSNISTEELLQLTNTGKYYIAIANWE